MSARIKEFPGEEVKLADLKGGKVPAVRDRARAKYVFSAGIAMSKFLNELKKGKILASTCNKCGRIMVPPRMFCEQCFKPTDGWTYVKDTGTINTYSVPFVGGDASRLKEPIIAIVVDLDGASLGMGILHTMKEVDWKKVKFGMKVKAVWKPEKERTGAITDIKYFKPLREE